MRFPIFIGWDSRFPEPALVAAHSFRVHSSIPLDIRFLDLRHLRECYKFNPAPDERATTEFTRSRFLVPWLCGYSGHALFVDNDVVCLADVARLIDKCRWSGSGPALQVVKHDHMVVDGTAKMYGATQTMYPRKNWSSLMLMDCSQLGCWSKHVVEREPPSRLHRFEDVPDLSISDLDRGWNDLDHVDADTKIVHYTSGGPWYPQYRDCPHAQVWYKAKFEYEASLN